MRATLCIFVAITCCYVSVKGKLETDYVMVTCTPVHHRSVTRCKCEEQPQHRIISRYATYVPTDEETPVECRIELSIIPVGGTDEIKNECHQVPHHPLRISCSALVRKSLLSFLRPTMIRHRKVSPYPEVDTKKKGQGKSCEGQCFKQTPDRGCVADNICLKCVDKFKSAYPGVDLGFNPCN